MSTIIFSCILIPYWFDNPENLIIRTNLQERRCPDYQVFTVFLHECYQYNHTFILIRLINLVKSWKLTSILGKTSIKLPLRLVHHINHYNCPYNFGFSFEGWSQASSPFDWLAACRRVHFTQNWVQIQVYPTLQLQSTRLRIWLVATLWPSNT